MFRLLFFVLLWPAIGPLWAQTTLSGRVVDAETNEALVGAAVFSTDRKAGAYTDDEGRFELAYTGSFPVTLQAQYVNYDSVQVVVTGPDQRIDFRLRLSSLEVVTVQGSRISEKIREDPQTVERMDLLMVKETPAANFYDGLGALKGVDVTAASMGFKVINTRGFNSTSPVRSLQLIDGVDNQSPGLNFSLGNFVGASELDVQSVDIIQGASGAAYGPGAFNGVISIQTKDPFLHPGLAVQLKLGERQLLDGALRYAKVFNNAKGRPFLAFKLNTTLMRANDWEANSLAPTDQSRHDQNNPGGYDAVNVYGDEVFSNFEDPTIRGRATTSSAFPGLGTFYRSGYREEDIVDYNTQSLKLGGSLHWKPTESIQAQYGYQFSSGTTVYQGDNRYSLKDLQFYQHRLALEGPNWHVRAYMTGEDAGKSYDAVFTALLLQRESATDQTFFEAYQRYWSQTVIPQIDAAIGFPTAIGSPTPVGSQRAAAREAWLASNYGYVYGAHADARSFAQDTVKSFFGSILGLPFLQPGTPEFQEAFNRIISSPSFTEGGSRFVDRSRLWHVRGEYTFEKAHNDWMPKWFSARVGASYRLYTPQSEGSIFSDTLRSTGDSLIYDINNPGEVIGRSNQGSVTMANDSLQNLYNTDPAFRNNLFFEPLTEQTRIRVDELGAWALLEAKFWRERLKFGASFRVDKSRYFDPVFSPQFSAVFTTFNKKHNFRINLASAVRNPTLTDQFLYYNVGRARLIGNIEGYDDVVTIDAYREWIDSPAPDTLDLLPSLFDVAPLVPEKVQTVEVGYKGNLRDNIFVDAGYWFSWYRDFIGFNLVTPYDVVARTNLPEPLRISANAQDQVTTQGVAVGLSWYFGNFYALTGNYTWTVLDKRGSNDPIIPAYNTPEHKFNVGIGARDLAYDIGSFRLRNLGFSINFKWVEGYLFEGSPQFTGNIDTYWTLDAQVSYAVPKLHTSFKLGASNLLNRRFIQAYGGPEIGRLAYFQVAYELKGN